METILEDQRRLHEERERLIDIQTKEILRKKATVNRHFFKKFSFKNPSKQIFFQNREQLNSDHLVKILWDVS